MRRASLAAVLVVACTPAAPDALAPHALPDAAPVVDAAVDGARRDAATAPAPATRGADAATTGRETSAGDEPLGSSADPLLIDKLDERRATILLASAGASAEEAASGAIHFLERSPTIVMAKTLSERDLPAAARAHYAPRYQIVQTNGSTCSATLESAALVHRILESDPTAGRDPGTTDDEYLARVFAVAKDGGASVVAVVLFDGPCAKPMGALPSAEAPLHLLQQGAARRADLASARAALKGTSEYDALVASGPPRVAAFTFGADFVWARAKAGGSGANAACFALHRDGPRLRAIGAAGLCPNGPTGATSSANGDLVVWFDHARAVVSLRTSRVTVDYFPIALFGPSDGEDD